jgi:hypothetical protein
MSQPPQMITCPAGHTFPRDQLTYRDGLSVCPVCDQVEWAIPRPTWSRRLLVNPLVLLAAAVLMFLVEAVSGVGIGADYQRAHVSGAAWLIAGSAVAIVGAAVTISGIIRLATIIGSPHWNRNTLFGPLAVITSGVAMFAIADIVELGLNIAFVNASNPGSGWQITAQVFDSLFYAGMAGAIGWAAALTRRPDPAGRQEAPTRGTTEHAVVPPPPSM